MPCWLATSNLCSTVIDEVQERKACERMLPEATPRVSLSSSSHLSFLFYLIFSFYPSRVYGLRCDTACISMELQPEDETVFGIIAMSLRKLLHPDIRGSSHLGQK